MSHQMEHTTSSEKVRALAFCPRSSRCKNLSTFWHSRNLMCSTCCASSAQMTHLSIACPMTSKCAETTVTEVSAIQHFPDIHTLHARVNLPAWGKTSTISSFPEKRAKCLITYKTKFLDGKEGICSGKSIVALYKLICSSLPSISGKDYLKIPQQFNLSICLLLLLISTLLNTVGDNFVGRSAIARVPLPKAATGGGAGDGR